ncbi:uncharacterized protein B0H18DRAFT_1121583 [Fomitopsis serialis]|uniref:uncharacterized protein n=1 Tax=Fomitopsis serialis TaxID=139415 RepID=UPI002008E9E6|nr:uncharacterized protein B0H18DRAFT_1121583 [Neoantrodia serialis]KAH9921006.1 hypothetical protein B0H18DRAFT_1121583 [Neoantrodia serialis]
MFTNVCANRAANLNPSGNSQEDQVNVASERPFLPETHDLQQPLQRHEEDIVAEHGSYNFPENADRSAVPSDIAPEPPYLDQAGYGGHAYSAPSAAALSFEQAFAAVASPSYELDANIVIPSSQPYYGTGAPASSQSYGMLASSQSYGMPDSSQSYGVPASSSLQPYDTPGLPSESMQSHGQPAYDVAAMPLSQPYGAGVGALASSSQTHAASAPSSSLQVAATPSFHDAEYHNPSQIAYPNAPQWAFGLLAKTDGPSELLVWESGTLTIWASLYHHWSNNTVPKPNAIQHPPPLLLEKLEPDEISVCRQLYAEAARPLIEEWIVLMDTFPTAGDLQSKITSIIRLIHDRQLDVAKYGNNKRRYQVLADKKLEAKVSFKTIQRIFSHQFVIDQGISWSSPGLFKQAAVAFVPILVTGLAPHGMYSLATDDDDDFNMDVEQLGEERRQLVERYLSGTVPALELLHVKDSTGTVIGPFEKDLLLP